LVPLSCGPVEGEEEELPSAEEIVNNAIASFDDIKTYHFDMIATTDTIGEVEGQALEHTAIISISGTLDLEVVRMSSEASMVAVMPGEDEVEERVETYIIDGMMYAKIPEAPTGESMWIKLKVTEEAWEMQKRMSNLENYKELLETAQVEVLGSEKVEGVDCYLLQLNPKMEQLWQAAGSGGGAVAAPTVPEDLLQEAFNDFTVKQWMAKDTYFLMKVEMDMVMKLTSEIMDYLSAEEGEYSIHTTVSFLAKNYNQPVTIILPSEAEEAVEMQDTWD